MRVTFVSTLLALALINVATADTHAHAHKRHASNRDRMLKSRQLGILGDPGSVGTEAPPPSDGDSGVANAGSDPTGLTGSSSSSVATSSASSSSSSAVTTSSASATTTGNILSGVLSGVLGSGSSTTSSATTTSSSSLSSSSSSSSSSSITSKSSSSSTTSSSSSSSIGVSSPAPSSPSSQSAALVTDQPSASTVVATQIVQATPTGNSTTNAQTDAAKSTTTITKDTVTAIVAVAASIGAIILIWTGIRKWKFSPSKDFNDRLQAIDWEPTGHDSAESGIPGHRRVASVASSFRSGENATGYGGSLAPLPEHDFTAGPASYGAPVGGYADLARGSSPQPQQMVQRGPSLNHGYGATNY